MKSNKIERNREQQLILKLLVTYESFQNHEYQKSTIKVFKNV